MKPNFSGWQFYERTWDWEPIPAAVPLFIVPWFRPARWW